jgi:hypothetical protein
MQYLSLLRKEGVRENYVYLTPLVPLSCQERGRKRERGLRPSSQATLWGYRRLPFIKGDKRVFYVPPSPLLNASFSL